MKETKKETMKIRDLLTKEIDIDCGDDYDESILIAFCGPQRLTEEGYRKFAPVLDCFCEVDEYDCSCVLKLDGPDENETKMRVKLANLLFYGAAGYISEDKIKKYFVNKPEEKEYTIKYTEKVVHYFTVNGESPENALQNFEKQVDKLDFSCGNVVDNSTEVLKF